ncbi:MAG: thioredoxin [Promethearchaeota archaeon]
MSDNELEKIKQRKAEMLLKLQSMPSEIITIHGVNELNKLTKDFPDNVILIDLWAVWCGPCRIFAPIFEKLHQEYSKDFIFTKVNVDENPSIAQIYGITAIPTTLLIKNGKIVKKFVGVMNYEALKQILEKLKS